MQWNPKTWNPKARLSMAVLVPELTLAPAAALGAVYCASILAPHTLKKLEATVSKHIVLPHLAWFESRAGSLKKVREEYAQKKRERMIANGEPVEELHADQVVSPQERANVIASVLTRGAIAIAADLAATGLGHRYLSKKWNIELRRRVAYFETGVHLGGIAMMAGPLAKLGEDVHHSIKRKLKKVGVNEESAEDLGTVLPYIVFPGQVAALGSLGLAFALNGFHR